MEVDSVSEPPLPAEFWKIFYTSVPVLFNNDDDIVQKLGIIIEKCKVHYEYYVAPIVGQREKYEANISHYIAFTTWLLGQLVRATTMEKLECYHTQFVDWQMNILDLLATRNQNMFVIIILKYLAAVKDLTAARNHFQDSPESQRTFQWFHHSPHYQSESQPILEQFEIENSGRCASVLIYLLRAVKSQTCTLCECTPQSLEDYWSSLLDLLEDSHIPVVAAALESATAIILTSGFPCHRSIVSRRLCLVLDSVASLVSSRHSGNCDNNESIKPLLMSFSAFFRAVLASNGTGTEANDILVFQTLISLLDVKNPFLYSGCTSKDYCKLLSQFLKTFDINIEPKMSLLLNHASHFPAILFVVETLVLKNLEKYFTQNSESQFKRDMKAISSLWEAVWELTLQSLESLRADNNVPATTLRTLQLVTAVVQTAANIALDASNLTQDNFPLVFFGDKFYRSYNILIQEIDLNLVYHEIVKSSKYLISLQESSKMNRTEIHKLLVFISVPWLKHVSSGQPPKVNLTPYLTMANLHLFPEDASVQLDCIEGLMLVCDPILADCRVWWLTVLSQTHTRTDTTVTLLRMLPVLVARVSSNSRAGILSQLVLPLFTSQDSSVLISLTKTLPSVLCALAGTAQLTRNNGKELSVQCKVCDKQLSDQPSAYIEDSEQLVVTMLQKYLQLQESQSIHIRKNVGMSLKNWIKHIKEPTLRKYLVKWLMRMKDPEDQVGICFAAVSRYVVSADCGPELLRLFCDVVMAISYCSLRENNGNLQLSAMAFACTIGCQPTDEFLWPIIKVFLVFLGQPSAMHPTVAQNHLNKIAVARKKSVQDIFFKYQDEIIQVISTLLIHNYLLNPKSITITLLNLSRGLGFQSIKDFLDSSARKYLMKHLLPLIMKEPSTIRLLSVVSANAGLDIVTLLKNSFQYVYPHIVLFERQSVVEVVCEMFEQYTELPLQSLICFSFKVITCELLLYFHKEKTKVTEVLMELRKYESESDGRLSNSSSMESDIAQFIQPRFLAVLAYLDSILVSRSGCESTKRLALLALPDLINLMGAVHITSVRFKVLATLRSALNLYHSYFPELICFAWRAFILNVSTIGPLLSTIFVSLLPLLDQYPVEISSVFQILILNNRESVSGYLAELYFLPDTPATHQIYNLVQAELEQLRNLPVKDQLAMTLRMATHENSDVRIRGLYKLRQELCLHRQQVCKLIVANDNMHPFILQLLEALISGCRDSHEGVRLTSSQCLGEIGAVDPGHIPYKVNVEDEEKEMYIINSDAFVLRALNEFVKAFQAANHTTTMDSFAFGIQELLKLYKVSDSEVWNQLPDSTKEIISPFRESRYRDLAADSDNQPLIPHPIFGTIHGSTFRTWAVNWVCRLIPTVTDEFVRKVFSVCQLGLKKDLQTLLFFLPYIVLYAILGATKIQSKRIAEEISAVLFWNDDQPTSLNNPNVLVKASVNSESSLTHLQCAKTVYHLFDFLYRWLRQMKQKIKPKEECDLASHHQKLSDFLKNFSKLEIAEGSYRCREYTRALLFLEEYMSENPNSVQSYLPTLGKIYYKLDDPDGCRGIIAIQETEPTAQEMILYHEVTGKLQDAAACYERLGQEDMPREDFYRSMVQCYLSLDQPYTALKVARGLLDSVNKSEQSDQLLDERAVAMLSLSMFPQLEQLLEGRKGGWGVSLGQALLHLSKYEGPLMTTRLDKIRAALVRSLSSCSVSQSGYRHGYDTIVKLHIIAEVEKLGQMVLKMADCKSTKEKEQLFRDVVVDELEERLKVVQPSCRVLQQVLCVRRVVLSLAQQMLTDTSPDIVPLFSKEIGNSWLKSIEIARKSGHYQQAYTNILTVEPYKPKGLFVEKAKLLWAKAEPEAALNTLKRGIEYHFPDAADFKSMSPNCRKDDRMLCAQAKLMIAVYNDENVNIDMETNLANYASAVEVCRNWEKSIVCLAQYKYKYLRTFSENPESVGKTLEYQVHMINFFGKSLQYGCEYIYQSMPRMLSIWLDFGSQLAQDILLGQNKSSLSERREAMEKMTTLVGTYSERLPTYMFMTAFSQIISRICHPQKECYKTLKAIIIKIIIAYPQQALWMFLSVYKSPYTVRVKRCEEVLRSSEIQKEIKLCQTINGFRDLFDRLIELSNKSPPSSRGTVTVSIKSFMANLHRLVSNPTFSPVVIPLQKFRTISLPRSTTRYHNPFPEDMVYISGMKDDIVILPSLQKPRKITFIGTDGKHYPMMCKPNDDLRLDSRMMEFNSIVNMYLQRDADARDRSLHIRTYSAVPLNDTSGLIEWVPNLVGLRMVIATAYKQMGINMTSKEYKEICCTRSDPLEKKRQVFIEKLLPRHPAVLREWYLKEFSHPTTWYLARAGYVRTLAVMSIVGFMLGLGDRHGENILLDATCGDVVHVDFNCLFNKGERFDWPERVPFRLTHNLVDAMGPTGVEGVYKHSCEITTRVMRQQIDQLMSVVRPFCYDPLVSWNTNRNARDENAEMTNEKALEDIQNIESRLQGFVATRKRASAFPLSVEGQVSTLIGEATNIDNLCQMYVGWGPYL